VGVDQQAYPRDFATFVRYHGALLRSIPERLPLPPPLALKEFESFMQARSSQHGVTWAAADPS
jgi:hypothetical protein